MLNELGQRDPERRKRLESQLSVASTQSGSGTKSPSPERISPERRLSKQKSIVEHGGSVRRTLSTVKEKDGELPSSDGVEKKVPEKDLKSVTKLIEVEKSETGSVKWDVYVAYLKANGYFLTFLVCMFIMMSNAFQVASNVWLADWSNEASHYVNETPPDTPERLAGYAGLGFGQGRRRVTDVCFRF